MKRILITGANGMLGKEIVKRFSCYELVCGTTQRKDGYVKLDITNRENVEEVLDKWEPNMIINCAAFTNVEEAEHNQIDAYRINTLGPKILAETAAERDIILVHFSTDYVYGGGRPLLLAYSEKSCKLPTTTYGATKNAGDNEVIKRCNKHYIFRTSWLFGDGKNFVDTIIKASENANELKVVSNQCGSPTYTKDLADIVFQATEKEIPYGTYNATNLGFTSWYEFAKLILPNFKNIIPIKYQEYGSSTLRPENSKLSKRKILKYGIEIPTYQDALFRYLETRK